MNQPFLSPSLPVWAHEAEGGKIPIFGLPGYGKIGGNGGAIL